MMRFDQVHRVVCLNSNCEMMLFQCLPLTQVMIKNLDRVVSMVLNSFQHPHPRVRWAAINAIGQLSTDLGPDLQVQYHQQVLPALAAAMDDFQNPRVQVHFCKSYSLQFFMILFRISSCKLNVSIFNPLFGAVQCCSDGGSI